MAEDKSKKAKEESKPTEGGGWLRLPKMWADGGDKGGDKADGKADEAKANETVAGVAVTSQPATTQPSPANLIEEDGGSTADDPLVREEAPTLTNPNLAAGAAPPQSTPDDAFPLPAMPFDLEEIKSEMEHMNRIVNELNERESSMEQVFNTLHSELMDYKKDFIYEHLKPVVRPLLFLYDSLEQFDREIELYERPSTDERRQCGLAPRLVRENIGYFREQLVEALRICEVTLMETPSGDFIPRLQKAIDVAPVDQSQDNQIIRVVRAGWYLNNQVLRPAEVVVGKAVPRPQDEVRADGTQQIDSPSDVDDSNPAAANIK